MASNEVQAMFVIRLASGNLLVPEYAATNDDRILGNAYVEIGPDHADYTRLAAQAITPEEESARRQLWRDGDEALRREFLDYLARYGSDGGWNDRP
ncbi:MAG TPA: hypothetical protein VMA72_15185 [Streptosporangiaceae bacterium]|nr:hypothetical protein [Streptosporangiaceae bacterium]